MISGSATNPKLTEQGFKNAVPRRRPRRPAGPGDRELPRRPSCKPKVVAVIDDATAYGEGIANEVEKTLKAAEDQGAAAREGHRQDHRLEGDPHQDARAAIPTPCSTAAWTPPAARCSSRARELGIKAVFAFGDGACTDEMKKLAGDGGRRAAVLAGRHPAAGGVARNSSTRSRRSSTPIRSSTRRSPTTRANLLIEAMKKANSADPAKYLPELQKIELHRRHRPRSRSTTRATARTPR